MYATDGSDDDMSGVGETSAFSHLALPDTPAQLLKKQKPFLVAPSKSSIYQSLEAAYHHQSSVNGNAVVLTEEDLALAQFLEKLNPGLGQTALVLKDVGLASQEAIQKLSTDTWAEMCSTKVCRSFIPWWSSYTDRVASWEH